MFHPITGQPNANENEFQNFDNTLNSFLAIIVIITLDGKCFSLTLLCEPHSLLILS
jgi:hypothetical protein